MRRTKNATGKKMGSSRLSRAARRVRDELVVCLGGKQGRNKKLVLKHRYWQDRVTGRWHGVELLVPKLKLGINIHKELDDVGRSCIAKYGIKVVKLSIDDTFNCREVVRKLVAQRKFELDNKYRNVEFIDKIEYQDLVNEYLKNGGRIKKYDSKGRPIS